MVQVQANGLQAIWAVRTTPQPGGDDAKNLCAHWPQVCGLMVSIVLKKS